MKLLPFSILEDGKYSFQIRQIKPCLQTSSISMTMRIPVKELKIATSISITKCHSSSRAGGITYLLMVLQQPRLVAPFRGKRPEQSEPHSRLGMSNRQPQAVEVVFAAVCRSCGCPFQEGVSKESKYSLNLNFLFHCPLLEHQHKYE